jgi:hypothetical protein
MKIMPVLDESFDTTLKYPLLQGLCGDERHLFRPKYQAEEASKWYLLTPMKAGLGMGLLNYESKSYRCFTSLHHKMCTAR